MIWLQLKIQMIPIISVEINNTITLYKNLLYKLETYQPHNCDNQPYVSVNNV